MRGTEQPIHVYRHVTALTPLGRVSFTDVCFTYRNEFYGSRYHGILLLHEIQAEGLEFLRRRKEEQTA